MIPVPDVTNSFPEYLTFYVCQRFNDMQRKRGCFSLKWALEPTVRWRMVPLNIAGFMYAVSPYSPHLHHLYSMIHEKNIYIYIPRCSDRQIYPTVTSTFRTVPTGSVYGGIPTGSGAWSCHPKRARINTKKRLVLSLQHSLGDFQLGNPKKGTIWQWVKTLYPWWTSK